MKKFIILIPIYNDWKSVFQLLENIDLQIAKWDAEVLVLIINDGSTEERTVTELSFKNIKTVRVMNMKQNRGHARCNAAGLKYLTEKGYISVNGASITIGKVIKNTFYVHLIPETLKTTNLDELIYDNYVNLEFDQTTIAIVDTTERLINQER